MHDSSIRQGKIVERHLCEACARRAGIATSSPEIDPDLLSELLAAQAAGETAPGKARDAAEGPRAVSRCPRCELAFAAFRQGGLLGCPSCYTAFESQLAPMLQRYHEGSAQHVGKVPRRAGTGMLPPGAPPPPALPPSASPPRPAAPASSVSDLAKRVAVLRGQLAAAIQNEQYERAAQVRDELRRLGDPNLSPDDRAPRRRPEGPER